MSVICVVVGLSASIDQPCRSVCSRIVDESTGGMAGKSARSAVEKAKTWIDEGDLYVVRTSTASRAHAGHAGLVLTCQSELSSPTSSSRLALSNVGSHADRAPGETIVLNASHTPTPTNVASARKMVNVGSIDRSWVIVTPRASVTGRHLASGSCSSEVK